jgi:signal transduction histidine kinase
MSDLEQELISQKLKAEEIINKDPARALFLLQEVYEKASFNKLSLLENEVIYLMGYCNLKTGNNIDAFQLLQSAKLRAEKDNQDELEQKTLVALGVYFRGIGDLSNAIIAYKEALNGPKEEYKIGVYNNIAVIYHQIQELDSALDYYEKALELLIEGNNPEILLATLTNMGRIYTDKEMFEEGLAFLQKAKELAFQMENEQFIMLSNLMLGRLFNKTNQIGEALDSLETAYKINVEKGFRQHSHAVCLELAEVYEKTGRLNDAVIHYVQALEFSRSLGIRNQIECLNRLKDFYSAQSDYQRAFETSEELNELIAKQISEEKKQELTKLKSSFELSEKQKEIERLKQENDLKSKLIEKSIEIEEKNRRLLLINEELVQFSYAISHDLREPARMIINFSQILDKSLSTKLDPKEKELFDFVSNNAAKMDLLINDLYRYATLGISDSKKVSVDLNLAVSSALDLLKLKMNETGAHTVVGDLPSVKGYPALMVQLFQNLISNSLKYRNPQIAPEITIWSEEEDNNYLISVKDNGIGIPPEYQEKVFKIFKRVHQDKSIEGTGIGLAICHKIAVKAAGDLKVFSLGTNQGTTFTVVLPKQNRGLGE